MTTRRKVLAALVLDASGSMASAREATISGVNEWVEDQKRVTESDMDILYVQFASRVGPTWGPDRLADFPGVSHREYIPDGWTALYDAVGTAIRTMETHEADSYLVLIVTDGQENRSQEFRSVEAIRALIQQKEAAGNWTFVFLGASADAWGGGAAMGLTGQNVAQNAGAYTPQSARVMYAALSQDTTRYRGEVQEQSVMRSVNFAQNTAAALDPNAETPPVTNIVNAVVDVSQQP
jgi:hypothetical protein